MWPQRSSKVTNGHFLFKKVTIYNISSTFIYVWIFMKFFEHTNIMRTQLFQSMICDLRGHRRSQKVTKRPMSITLLALLLMYESFWIFLRIFILWWCIFFIIWHVTSEVIEGQISSSKRSISIASLALSLIYESLWNFLSILTLWLCIFFIIWHVTSKVIKGHI